VRAVPPFPAVANALLRLALDENVGLAKVSEVVATDAAISLEVLRIVNTGFIGVRGEVSSVPQAAAILGLRRISTIAGAVAIRASLGRWWRAAPVRRCWHHNLASALSAEYIARLIFRDADTAHAAGLLHDIGRFVLVVHFGDEYVRLLQSTGAEDGDLRAREQALFDIDHSEAGRMLLEQLGLPSSMSNVAAAHHDVPTDEGTQFVHVVRVACKFATAIRFGLHDDSLPHTPHPVPDQRTLHGLLEGLPPAYRAEVARQSEAIRDRVVELVAAYDRALV
jgi:putative nucleotidyltransferase with HDIG domain